LRDLGNGLDRTYSELVLGRLRDPVLGLIQPAPRCLSYCPRYRHRPLYHMPPAYAHRCSSEGSEPGCASLAQPARIESTHSRVTTVAANLMIRCPR